MRILLDCDGILADFPTPYLAVIEELTGLKYTIDQLKDHEFLKALDLECIDKDVKKLVYKKGYCRNIPVYEGAKEGVKLLQEIGEVIIVTSPMISAPYWMYERAEWLNTHFGIRKENLIFATKKECVQGDIFIDDNITMYRNWSKHNNGVCRMWKRPWNEKYNGNKISSWREVIECCYRRELPLSVSKINKYKNFMENCNI